MLSPIESLLLGVLQGITEFLPVSSSGHLVIAQQLFGITEPVLLFDILVHVATLLAIIVYYRRDLAVIGRDGIGATLAVFRGGTFRGVVAEHPGSSELLLLALASIPTALIGLSLRPFADELFHSIREVGEMLLVTGLVLLSTRSRGLIRPGANRPISALAALAIGLAQGIAVVPGISRSGMTIAVALWLGASPRQAARFSFLLSIPAILGALVLGARDAELGVSASTMALGFSAALVVGYVSLAFLIQVIEKNRLVWFAPYCLVLGSVVISASIWG